MWDAAQYLKFSEERARPFLDLLTQVRPRRTDFIADLGCGPGLLTRTLADRWPTAHVVGVDNSAAMLAQARSLAIADRLEFVAADLAAWTPAQPLDLLVSNAALQWVGDHAALLPRLVELLAPGGTLAVQIPDRFDAPAQDAIEETTADPRWADLLRGVGLQRDSVQRLEWYVRQLLALGLSVNAWATTYIHVLSGDNPVLEWFKGSALRPLLQRLQPEQQSAFLHDLGERFAALYPPVEGITLLPFPRLFFVASRPGEE